MAGRPGLDRDVLVRGAPLPHRWGGLLVDGLGRKGLPRRLLDGRSLGPRQRVDGCTSSWSIRSARGKRRLVQRALVEHAPVEGGLGLLGVMGGPALLPDLGLRERGCQGDIGPGLPLCEAPLAGLDCSSGCFLGDLLLNHELLGAIRALGVAPRVLGEEVRTREGLEEAGDALGCLLLWVDSGGCRFLLEIHSAAEPAEDEVHRLEPGLGISRTGSGGRVRGGSLSDLRCRHPSAPPMRPPDRDAGIGACGCTSSCLCGALGARRRSRRSFGCTRGRFSGSSGPWRDVVVRRRSRCRWGLTFGERRAVAVRPLVRRASGRDCGTCTSRTRGSSIRCRLQRLRRLLCGMLHGELLAAASSSGESTSKSVAAASPAAAGVGVCGAATAEALASAAALAAWAAALASLRAATPEP